MLGELAKAAYAMTALCCALLCASPASAQPTAPSGSATIVLTYDPSTSQGEPALEAVRAHLAGMPIQILIEAVPQTTFTLGERLEISGELAAQRQALGAFSIEVGKESILVFFTEPGGRSALVRRIRSNEKDLSVVREEAAIVVRSLVQALLEGKRIGMMAATTPTAPGQDRAAKGSSSQQPSPPEAVEHRAIPVDDESQPSSKGVSTKPPRRTLAAGVGYVGTRLAPQLSWQSGLAFELRWFVSPQVYLGGGYSVFASQRAVGQTATIELTRHPVELALGYEGRSPVALTAELTALFDIIHRSTLDSAADYQRTPGENQLMLGVGLRGGLVWGPVDWLRAIASAGADVAARRVSFVSRRDDTETVTESSIVSPKILVGVAAYLP